MDRRGAPCRAARPASSSVHRHAPLRCGRWGRRSPGRGSRAASRCVSGEDIACHIRVVDKLLRNVGPRWSGGKEKLCWLTKLQPVGNKSLPILKLRNICKSASSQLYIVDSYYPFLSFSLHYVPIYVFFK
jgi:hypothetical protein